MNKLQPGKKVMKFLIKKSFAFIISIFENMSLARIPSLHSEPKAVIKISNNNAWSPISSDLKKDIESIKNNTTMPIDPKRSNDIFEHKKKIKKIKKIFALFPEKKNRTILIAINIKAILGFSFAMNITGVRKMNIKKRFEKGK